MLGLCECNRAFQVPFVACWYRYLTASASRLEPLSLFPQSRQRPLGPQYQLLWSAVATSTLGDGLLIVGLPLLADAISGGDPLAVSLLLVAQRAPWILMALVGGAAADRREARALMIRADLIRLGILSALALSIAAGSTTVPLLLMAAIAIGVLDVVFWAAAQRMIPMVAAPDQLERANGRLGAAQSAGEQVIGPVAGGALFRLGRVLPLIGDALSFAVSAVLVRALPLVPPDPATSVQSFRESVSEGYKWFVGLSAESRRVRVTTLYIVGFATGEAFVLAPLVSFARRAVELTPFGVGVFLGVIAIGNVLGAATADRVLSHFSFLNILLLLPLVMTLAYFFGALTSSPFVAAVGLFVEAVLIMVATAAAAAMRQREVPSHLIARVSTLYRSLVYGAVCVGALAAGMVARYGGGWFQFLGFPTAGAGVRSSFLIGSIIGLTTVVVGARPLRRAMRP